MRTRRTQSAGSEKRGGLRRKGIAKIDKGIEKELRMTRSG